MLDNIIDTLVVPVNNEMVVDKSYNNGYDGLLRDYGLDFIVTGCYLQVGDIKNIQGWILHISVVPAQVPTALKKIIPFLITEKVAFKIPQDMEAVSNLQSGYMGIGQLGKIMSIYPDNEIHALDLAKKLISFTITFKGPRIPTDIYLGGAVYTRYGSHNPIMQPNEIGTLEKFIYDASGDLVRDLYAVPFELPKGIEWPFSLLASEKVVPPKSTFNGRYKMISVLKTDPKGNVYKGLYLKGLFNVKRCVIKQGFMCMCCEPSGRDIHDRLLWQKELYHELAGIIPLPKIIDLFQEDGNSLLVMEYIEGSSLSEKIEEINPNRVVWNELSIANREQLVDYLLKIVDIIGNLHAKKVVHRDVAPNNFLIDKKNTIFLIDVELSYSLNLGKPTPPFSLGTTGYMSPEQEICATPTIKEDIFAIGSLLINVLTGLAPIKFDVMDPVGLAENLRLFIDDSSLITTIVCCLNTNPAQRPDLSGIVSVLQRLKSGLNKQEPTNSINRLNKQSSLEKLVEAAIRGLNRSPLIVSDDLWYSRLTSVYNTGTFQHKEYTRYTGMSEGIAGILYLLARANKVGLDISSSLNGYNKGWEYIEAQYNTTIKGGLGGLYSGVTGTALALEAGIDSGLVPNDPNNREKIARYLEIKVTGNNIADGIAGKGLALLQCFKYLPETVAKSALDDSITILLSNQQNNGSWHIVLPGGSATENRSSISYGIPGILWFLLEYYRLYPVNECKKAIDKGLEWLIKKHKNSSKTINIKRGHILILIKAFEVLAERRYKSLAEGILRQYPTRITDNDYSQKSGLAGLGEIYCEAGQVFKNREWQERSDWIVDVFANTFKKSGHNSGYWIMEEMNLPTADFMTGNSGIIHFLLRNIAPEQIGYRFLK